MHGVRDLRFELSARQLEGASVMGAALGREYVRRRNHGDTSAADVEQSKCRGRGLFLGSGASTQVTGLSTGVRIR